MAGSVIIPVVQIAVIPARGGSKRIPRKNLREFAGLPVIAHSIRRAHESGLFDRVMVSTDDEAIAEVARQYGAEVPFLRPPELSDDHTATTAVVAHAIGWMETQQGYPQSVCCLYACAPLMQVEDLARGFALFASGRWDYVFAATSYPHPIQRAFHQHADGQLEMFWPEHVGTRSQDLPAALHDAGQFYWGRPAAWLRGTPVIGPSSTAVILPSWRVQDIDTPDDWVRAEHIMSVIGLRGDTC
jgi:pseudaminic acid cytidylyltransferase